MRRLQRFKVTTNTTPTTAVTIMITTYYTGAGMPPYSPADSYNSSIPTAVPTVLPTVTSNRVPAKGMKLGGASSKGPKNTMLDRSVLTTSEKLLLQRC
jgi:hypothetical protein